jgi:hypothetical protein
MVAAPMEVEDISAPHLRLYMAPLSCVSGFVGASASTAICATVCTNTYKSIPNISINTYITDNNK